MKVYMKNIEVIAWFKYNEHPVPIKFRLENKEGENIVISINRIIFSGEEKLAGNRMIVYRCSSVISNIERVYELKYEVDSCNWYLYKL